MNYKIKNQIDNLPERYKSLKFIFNMKNKWYILGKLVFSASYKGIIIRKAIKLQIEIPDSFPNEAPKIKELENKLSGFPHINDDGYFCLGTPESLAKALNCYSTLESFFDKILISFLYCAFYYVKHKKNPFPCASHGFIGRLEEYCLLFDVDDPLIALKFFNLVNKTNLDYNQKCPCGSGYSLKNCHKQKVDDLRELMKLNC